MSSPSPKSKPFSLESYASEAAGKPVEFWVDDDTMLTIERPTGSTLFAIEDAQRNGDSRQALREMCGPDNAEQIMDAFGALPAAAMQQFIADLARRLGLGG